jgi:serine/threonine protein kinase
MIESGSFLQQRYRIDKQIGQGGMGAVYLATDERFNSTVAIKETLCMNDSFRKALETRGPLAKQPQAFRVASVSDHFLEDDGSSW